MAVKQVLTLTQLSQDVAANTSQVRILWNSTQTGGSYNLNERTASYWVDIGGTETEYAVTYKLHKGATDTILDTTITVPHDAAGKGAVTVRTWMDTRISAGEVTLTETLALADIPRAASVSATDAFIGGKSTVVVGVKYSGHTHSIAYQFGELEGFLDADGNVTDTEVRMTASVLNFALPESFYGEIPDSPSGICTLTCKTYAGEDLVGQNTGTFTAAADPAICAPVLSVSVEDCNETTLALTGDKNVLIRGRSTVRCQPEVSARNSAQILEIKLCGTVLADANSAVEFPNVTTGVFDLSATDSRGFTGTYRAELAVIPYFDVVCYPSAGRDDPTSGNGWLTVEGLFYDESFGAAENSLTVTYKVSDLEVTYAPTVESNRYADTKALSDLDYTKSYTVEVTVADALSSVTKSLRIQAGVPIFDWGEKDFRFNVKVQMPQLVLQENTVSDWIVEQGADENGWRYRKWASGLAECWGSQSLVVTDFTTQWGNLFLSGQETERMTYPVRFVQRPAEIVGTQSSDVIIVSAIMARGNTQSGTGIYRAVVGEEISDAGGLVTVITVDYYVAGLWKEEAV